MNHQLRSLDELREEFLEHDVRGWIWSWLHDLLVRCAKKRIKGRYRPQIYSQSREWDDDTITGLANEFILKKAIDKGVLAKALLVATDDASLEAYLATSFVRFVISERPRSLTRNLFDRLRDVLDGDPTFMRLANLPPHSQYGLAEWEDDPPALASEDLLANASRFIPSDIKWVTYGRGSRESPGLASADLGRIVQSLLSGIGRLLTAKQIMAVIAERYDLQDSIHVSDAELVSSGFTAPSHPLEAVEAEDLAKRAVNVLTERQKEIIALMLSNPSVISARDLANQLGISKSTAANELRAIQGQFRLLGANSESIQRQVLDVMDALFKAS